MRGLDGERRRRGASAGVGATPCVGAGGYGNGAAFGVVAFYR